MVLDNYPNTKQMFQCWSFYMILVGGIVIGSFSSLFSKNIVSFMVWTVFVIGAVVIVTAAFYKKVLWGGDTKQKKGGDVKCFLV